MLDDTALKYHFVRRNLLGVRWKPRQSLFGETRSFLSGDVRRRQRASAFRRPEAVWWRSQQRQRMSCPVARVHMYIFSCIGLIIVRICQPTPYVSLGTGAVADPEIMKMGGERQWISVIVIYRKRKQRTICGDYTDKGGLLKKIRANMLLNQPLVGGNVLYVNFLKCAVS